VEQEQMTEMFLRTMNPKTLHEVRLVILDLILTVKDLTATVEALRKQLDSFTTT
jgi:hypothetical protein